MNNLMFMKNNQSIERIEFNGMNISLLAGGDGTEVILHQLTKGNNWYIIPGGDWSGFEYLFLLSGELSCITGHKETVIKAGDSVSVQSIQEYVVFTAKEDSNFLYVSSQPVFQKYSNFVKDLIGLSVAIEEKDGITSEHCKRIRDLALSIGRKMDLAPYQINQLHHGAFFHDIGKTKISDYILGKPGKFTDEEYEIMKKHAEYGQRILMDSGIPLLMDASTIVLQHHERYNGSGYPNGLRGDEISICASIIAVVDSFDAMVTTRIYSTARTIESAVQEIKDNRGILYNPNVVDNFLDMLDYIKVIYNRKGVQ